MRVCDRAVVDDALCLCVCVCVCVYMSVFQGYIRDCSAGNTMLNSTLMHKWMCRRLIRERIRESMSECENVPEELVCMCVCVCVCLYLKWMINCHVFEWKTIHHPHQWCSGPVITCFPSFTLLMAVSLDQTLCCAVSLLISHSQIQMFFFKQRRTFDSNSSVQRFADTDYVPCSLSSLIKCTSACS